MSLFRSHPRAGVTSRQLRRWLPRTALGIALVTMTAGCQTSAWENLGLRQPATDQATRITHLWQGSWIAAIAVGVVVWGLILWSVIFHRRRSDRIPHQVRYNLPIEMLYTVLPFVMVGVLFYYTARDENSIDKLSAHPAVVVNVTGFQWSWSFQYPQYAVKSQAALCGGNSVCELGPSWNGKLGSSSNEGQMPLLEIPVHETVRFNLVSADVIHSFWIVPFSFKRDVVPGHPNHFEVTATRTGTSIGRCSELCGLYHSRMLFRVKIVSQAEFNAWIHQQQAQQNAAITTAAQTGSGSSQ
ncbi:MAG TPA: cytochrome c oxidase subunit II [Streptosporangiaceae bacterium]